MQNIDDLLKGLNEPQREAVTHVNGPLMIVAGAGSGKTRTMTYRIANLLYSGVPAYKILALTFTNKAAYEMRIRLSEHLNILAIKKMIISTFHSLGLEIIKQEIDALKFNENFTLFDEKDQIMLLKKICKKEIKRLTFLRFKSSLLPEISQDLKTTSCRLH